jgi:hypothetical protein
MSKFGSLSKKRKSGLFSTLLLGMFLLFLFQNFHPIPLDRLKPEVAWANVVSPSDGSADMRKLAPTRAQPHAHEVIAAPHSGQDMNSISQDWMSRQAHLITGGAEERMLADFNKKMNRIFKFEDEPGEEYPESGYPTSEDPVDESKPDSSDSSQGNGKKSSRKVGGRQPASIAKIKTENDYLGFRPTAMQLTAVNRLQLSLRNRTRVSCQFEGANVKWDVSRPINERFDVSFGHETSDARSTLRLNYSW